MMTETQPTNQLEALEQVQSQALAALHETKDEDALAQWRVAYLGRSSALMQTFAQIAQVPKDLRPAVGQRANQVKQALEAALETHTETLNAAALAHSLAGQRLDVTLPGRKPVIGRLHPSTQMLRELYRIFGDMGFHVYHTREVEDDEYNFQLLNFPPNHPARDMQDTFFIDTGRDRGDNPLLLRTHTSPGQIRAMRESAATNPENPPEVRVVVPGMCYRFEQVTHRSEMQFNQLEGLVVGRNVTLPDLKGTLSDFARRMFGGGVRTRFRPSFFPFTEPSAEMDVECFVCGGKGCPVCKGSGWLEILGCGMCHPVVLQNGGYDPRIFSGFAFGMGPERLNMLSHGIKDIRYFWGNDVRFLEQF
jgi:phenylalanyl-tRNA synthetase alpha chain